MKTKGTLGRRGFLNKARQALATSDFVHAARLPNVVNLNPMTKTIPHYAVALVVALTSAAELHAQVPAATPEVWLAPAPTPDGENLRALFIHPEQWAETRQQVHVLAYADHCLDRQFTDDELQAWLPMIESWGLKLALEVGAVKPWGQTGEKCFEIQRKKWDRFQRLGGKMYAIAMDEPLLCCRHHIHKSDEYALKETAAFIALVRKNYPGVRIGDIETYPSLSVTDNITWLDALQKKLAEKGVRGLDFYRLDVNWANFVIQAHGTWKEVRQIELACRQRKLPFSLIYWASDLPAQERKGVAGESSWYLSIMHQGTAYALVDGQPDQFVIQSWLKSGNPPCLPDSGPWTFTRTALDFIDRFVKTK